jgi:hypothetical protein
MLKQCIFCKGSMSHLATGCPHCGKGQEPAGRCQICSGLLYGHDDTIHVWGRVPLFGGKQVGYVFHKACHMAIMDQIESTYSKLTCPACGAIAFRDGIPWPDVPVGRHPGRSQTVLHGSVFDISCGNCRHPHLEQYWQRAGECHLCRRLIYRSIHETTTFKHERTTYPVHLYCKTSLRVD